MSGERYLETVASEPFDYDSIERHLDGDDRDTRSERTAIGTVAMIRWINEGANLSDIRDRAAVALFTVSPESYGTGKAEYNRKEFVRRAEIPETTVRKLEKSLTAAVMGAVASKGIPHERISEAVDPGRFLVASCGRQRQSRPNLGGLPDFEGARRGGRNSHKRRRGK